jgi:Raf kinase inhibitor-like YbhB/YbcL family protein
MKIYSKSFKNGDTIPLRFTCDGSDVSPELSWEDLPDETRSLALICDDPDASDKPWVHWIAFNIPVSVKSLPENITVDEFAKGIGTQGINSWGNALYGGPCPPGGMHRYFFRLYALDTFLPLKNEVRKPELLKAMKGHILGQAEIMGRYTRG